ncbi:MAG: hypothetical protein ACI3Z7_01055 [Candidatus Aphodosoma sp.]
MKSLYKYFVALFVASLLSAAPAALHATYRIVERSDRKTPDWVGRTIPGYLIFSAESTTLETARKLCMENIKQEIINSVAMNISTESSVSTGQKEFDGQYATYSEYSSEISSVAATLPYISGITVANAEDSYWEKRRGKEDKSESYILYIKYPFSRMDRNRLIAEFEQYDNEKYDTYLQIRQACDTMTSVDNIGRYINDLNPLIDYFFDNTRKSEARGLQRNLRNMYDDMAVLPERNEPGEYLYSIVSGGRRWTASRLPSARGSCARNFRVEPADSGLYRVKYTYGGCESEDECNVDLIFNFGGRTRRHSFNFRSGHPDVRLVPHGVVSVAVYRNPETADLADSVKIEFDMRCNVTGQFGLGNFRLSVPELEEISVRPDNATQEFAEGSNHLVYTGYGIRIIGPKSASLSNAAITVTDPDGNGKTVAIRLPYEVRYY